MGKELALFPKEWLIVKSRVTLRDVARLAKVSTSTASRALTGDPRILPDTKARVADAVAELHYLPNRIASSLRSKSTGIIGIAINNLDNYTLRTIFEQVGVQASQNSLQVLLVTTDGDPSREAQFLDTARELQLDGVIVAGSGENAERINMLVQKGFAVVITNRSVPHALATTIIPDYELSCRLAAEHLVGLGHKNIAYIGGLNEYQSGRENFAGYSEALVSAGIKVSEELVIRGKYDRNFGTVAATFIEGLYNSHKITAVIIANHESAHGLLLHLLKEGISIPKNLSVICVEDSPLIEFWNPAITAVDVQPKFLAESAFNSLLTQRSNSLNGDSTGSEVSLIRVRPRLVNRGSTRNP